MLPGQRVSAKQVYLDELASLVDEVRFDYHLETKSEAMRFILQAGLRAAGYSDVS
jgi:hypothetical protein